VAAGECEPIHDLLLLCSAHASVLCAVDVSWHSTTYIIMTSIDDDGTHDFWGKKKVGGPGSLNLFLGRFVPCFAK